MITSLIFYFEQIMNSVNDHIYHIVKNHTLSYNILFVCYKYSTNVLCKRPFVSIKHIVCDSFTKLGFDLVISFELQY